MLREKNDTNLRIFLISFICFHVWERDYYIMNCCFEKNVREIFIDLIAKEDDERVFLDRRAFSYSADDLHGNKLTPWRSARKKKLKKKKNKKERAAFDLSAYFRQVLDLCQAGRSISPEITVIIQPAATKRWSRRTVKTPSTRGEVSRVAGICMKRAAVLQNQFELLRFRLSPRFLLCLVRSETGYPLNFITPPRTSVCRAR